MIKTNFPGHNTIWGAQKYFAGGAPRGYGPTPCGYGPAPRGYGPAPRGYGPTPTHPHILCQLQELKIAFL